MERLNPIKLLPLKYKRKVNKLLRRLGLVAPIKPRVRKAKATETPMTATEVLAARPE